MSSRETGHTNISGTESLELSTSLAPLLEVIEGTLSIRHKNVSVIQHVLEKVHAIAGATKVVALRQ